MLFDFIAPPPYQYSVDRSLSPLFRFSLRQYSAPLLHLATICFSLCPFTRPRSPPGTVRLPGPQGETAGLSAPPGGRRADLHMRRTIMERNNDAISGEELSLIAVPVQTVDRKLPQPAGRPLMDQLGRGHRNHLHRLIDPRILLTPSMAELRGS